MGGLGSAVVTGDKDGRLHVWDMDLGQVSSQLHAHKGTVQVSVRAHVCVCVCVRVCVRACMRVCMRMCVLHVTRWLVCMYVLGMNVCMGKKGISFVAENLKQEKQQNETVQPKADKYPASHFSLLNCYLSSVMSPEKKGLP